MDRVKVWEEVGSPSEYFFVDLVGRPNCTLASVDRSLAKLAKPPVPHAQGALPSDTPTPARSGMIPGTAPQTAGIGVGAGLHAYSGLGAGAGLKATTGSGASAGASYGAGAGASYGAIAGAGSAGAGSAGAGAGAGAGTGASSRIPPPIRVPAVTSARRVSPDGTPVVPGGWASHVPSVEPPPDLFDPDNVYIQRGVVRTNCVDCLDRTNGVQQWIGVDALGQQFNALGLADTRVLNTQGTVVRMLVTLYSHLGDRIAKQYAGSVAHRKAGGGPSRPITQTKLFTTVARYYSNSFTDKIKQDALNLFLGVFRPLACPFPLWELESDFALHNSMITRYARFGACACCVLCLCLCPCMCPCLCVSFVYVCPGSTGSSCTGYGYCHNRNKSRSSRPSFGFTTPAPYLFSLKKKVTPSPIGSRNRSTSGVGVPKATCRACTGRTKRCLGTRASARCNAKFAWPPWKVETCWFSCQRALASRCVISYSELARLVSPLWCPLSCLCFKTRCTCCFLPWRCRS